MSSHATPPVPWHLVRCPERSPWSPRIVQRRDRHASFESGPPPMHTSVLTFDITNGRAWRKRLPKRIRRGQPPVRLGYRFASGRLFRKPRRSPMGCALRKCFRPHPLSWASAFHANEPIVHLHRGKQPSSCAMLPAHFALPSTGLVWKSGTRARIEQTIPDGIVAC